MKQPFKLTRRDAALNELDLQTMYGSGPKGYIDYPALES